MRTSNYRKFKITKKQAKLVGGAAAVAVLAGIIFFFAFFHVSKVEVMESNHYTFLTDTDHDRVPTGSADGISFNIWHTLHIIF